MPHSSPLPFLWRKYFKFFYCFPLFLSSISWSVYTVWFFFFKYVLDIICWILAKEDEHLVLLSSLMCTQIHTHFIFPFSQYDYNLHVWLINYCFTLKFCKRAKNLWAYSNTLNSWLFHYFFLFPCFFFVVSFYISLSLCCFVFSVCTFLLFFSFFSFADWGKQHLIAFEKKKKSVTVQWKMGSSVYIWFSPH